MVYAGSPFPYATLFAIEVFLVGWAETRRLMDIRNPGSLADSWFLGLEGNFKGTGTTGYPGQVHNPMNMGQDNMREMQVRAFAGFGGFLLWILTAYARLAVACARCDTPDSDGFVFDGQGHRRSQNHVLTFLGVRALLVAPSLASDCVCSPNYRVLTHWGVAGEGDRQRPPRDALLHGLRVPILRHRKGAPAEPH